MYLCSLDLPWIWKWWKTQWCCFALKSSTFNCSQSQATIPSLSLLAWGGELCFCCRGYQYASSRWLDSRQHFWRSSPESPAFRSFPSLHNHLPFWKNNNSYSNQSIKDYREVVKIWRNRTANPLDDKVDGTPDVDVNKIDIHFLINDLSGPAHAIGMWTAELWNTKINEIRIIKISLQKATCTPKMDSDGCLLRRAHSEHWPCKMFEDTAISPHVTSAPKSLQILLKGRFPT